MHLNVTQTKSNIMKSCRQSQHYDNSPQLLLKKAVSQRTHAVDSPVGVDLEAHLHQLSQTLMTLQNLIACLQAIYILPVLELPIRLAFTYPSFPEQPPQS